MRRVLVALLLTGCSAQEIDGNAPGSTTHEAYVVVNVYPKLPTSQAYIDASDQRANQLAATKCGTMRVVEVTRIRQSINTVLLTFRCQP